jgi:predicted nucleic acid-binding protein
MARKHRAVVLDSWAVLAYLGDETAGEIVANLIADATDNDTPLLMSAINAGEVWYILAREISETEADQSITGLKQLGIEFVDTEWKLVRAAAAFKAKHRMSYADCFAAALAKERNAELVTGDHEFRQVEAAVKIRWLVRG